MLAKAAIDRLEPETWAATSPVERLRLLKEVRANVGALGDALAASDTKMKNDRLGEDLYSIPMSKVGTAVPVANTLTACIDLYEHVVRGEMPKPISITKVRDGLHDIKVFPKSAKDRLMNAGQSQVLRVRGQPRQINPMEKPAGIIGVLGAGNYSSSLEMVKAMFLENCAVVHKPHHLNEATDAVWARAFAPLVEHGALTFCDPDQGKELTTDPRLSKIYFTGGSGTARAIMAATDTSLVSECGGNNPGIIVPGDRPWTEKELYHQAVQIVTASKVNGGAVCGRVQTLVTSKHWPQREAFLAAIRKAITDQTPAAGTYYPGSDKVAEGFLEAYPDAEILESESGRYGHSDFWLITGCEEASYATTHEAFCQIMDEVPLDVPAEADVFLPAATAFCNERLLGTLACCILIDETTKKKHQASLDEAVTDLRYGGIAVNTMPPFIFLSPYLTWGGNEEGPELVSGRGNFGNVLCFENVEKSILTAGFMSMGHMLNTNKADFDALCENMSRYSLDPSWKNLSRLIGGVVISNVHGKDF